MEKFLKILGPPLKLSTKVFSFHFVSLSARPNKAAVLHDLAKGKLFYGIWAPLLKLQASHLSLYVLSSSFSGNKKYRNIIIVPNFWPKPTPCWSSQRYFFPCAALQPRPIYLKPLLSQIDAEGGGDGREERGFSRISRQENTQTWWSPYKLINCVHTAPLGNFPASFPNTICLV